MVDNAGVMRRTHYQKVWAQTGRKPSELEVPEIPEEMAYIWSTFLDLHGVRTKHEPITYSEIFAYSQIMKIELSPMEVDIIKRLDRVWFEVLANDNNS